jgi:hypothetical protein
MTLAKRLRRLNFVAGLSIVLAVNAIGAVPRVYKGVQHPVGHENISIYVPSGEERDMLTPVEEVSNRGIRDTGVRVQVYVRNGYKDDIVAFYPRVTVLVLLAMALIHLLLKVLADRPNQTLGRIRGQGG